VGCFPHSNDGNQEAYRCRPGRLESHGTPDHEWKDAECEYVCSGLESKPPIEDQQANDYRTEQGTHQVEHLAGWAERQQPRGGQYHWR
jgi:hypothetical protein